MGRTRPSASHWHLRCPASTVTEGYKMLMFNRSQLYVGLGLAAVVEIIIRVVVH
jgi:hypothetical protein